MAVPIQRWIEAQGFLNGHPFDSYEADRDLMLNNYFISPEWFDALRGNTLYPQSAILFAARGHGKSSQRRQIAHLCANDKNPALIVELTSYEWLRDPADERIERLYVRKIVQIGVERILHRIAQNPAVSEAFARAPQHLVQLHGLLHWSNPQRRMLLPLLSLNNAQRAALATRQGVDPSHLPSEAGLLEQMVQAYATEELSQIQKDLLSLAQLAGCHSIYVLIDRVDEDPETEYDAVATVRRLQPIISNLHIIECTGYAFKFFLPDYLHQELLISRVGRLEDRIATYSLQWDTGNLRDMLRQRLSYFSRERSRVRHGLIDSLNDLCESAEATFDADTLLITAARGSPRRMIQLARHLIEHHCRNAQEATDLIPRTVIEQLLPSPVPWLRVDEHEDIWLGSTLITTRLTNRDRQLLGFFWKNRGRYQNYAQIKAGVYDKGQVDESVDRAITRLRNRLQPHVANSRDYIDYDRLRGYRLINYEGSFDDIS